MANDYRLLLAVREGLGTITVNGVAPAEFYTEGDVLTIAVAPDSGFHTAKWYSLPGNTLLSPQLSFSFTMPSQDTKVYTVLTGQNVPINTYGLKYQGGYATNYGGNVWDLQIQKLGYSGAVTPLEINDITYNWGNTGNDPTETIIGSSIDFTIAGETGDFNEFLVGGNRTWKVVLNQVGDNNDITDWNGVSVTNGYKDIVYGNGIFVATFGPFLAYSLDGITWVETIPVGWQANAITYGNGLFVAVGFAVVSGTPTAFAYSSTDGINWTSRTPAANNNWVSVSFGNDLFVAVASSGASNRIMTSPDGITWTARNSGINPNFTGVAYGTGIWVAISDASTGGTTFTSYDGFTWDEQATAFGQKSIIYANGLFTTGNFYSVDGLTWNVVSFGTTCQGLAYGNGYFVAVTNGGTNRILYSTDAITWTAIPAASVATFVGIAFGENTFVAVADGGPTNRINYLLFEGIQSFFTGFIAPDFITSPYSSGNKLFQFTAIDGLKGLDSIRSNFASWPDPRTQALSAVVGGLNQSFVDKRDVFVGVNIHETRMNDTISPFRQFNVPLNAIYTDGETAKFSNGVRIENEQLYLKDTIERMVNPFLGRVFLWRDKFYVIRLNEYNQISYKAFTFDPNQSLLLSETIINGDDINADINRPEETARRVFTEFNAFLNLGILDKDSQGGVFDAKFESTEWNFNSSASPYPNTYQLTLWDYHNAIPSLQPSSVPSGATALVQYVADSSGEYCQIWTTTTTAGASDPNISWISANTNSTGGAITIAQETANTISLTFEYMVERVGSAFPITPAGGTHSVGLMVKIGNQYLYRDTTTTFDWTATPTVMQFAVTAGSVWNSIAINNVLVPVDGEVEIRLYQLICNGGTANRYVIRYDNISLKIEKTDGLSLSKLGVKAVTGSPYANVHPDYNTYIGDAITSNSASAIQLLTAGNPVSELWSRDGVETLPLLDIIVQELANLKGRTNYRIMATLERRPIEPWRSFLFNGRYWALVSYQLNCRTGTAQIELYDLGIEPTT
jgi:hypothetical protein